MNNAEKLKVAQGRLAYIKGEAHNAVHPSLLRDRLIEVIEVFEWLFFEQVSSGDPHVVPGVPLNQLDDPNRTRVTFVQDGRVMPQQMMAPAGGFPAQQAPMSPPPWSPASPAPGSPIRSSDIQIIPGPVGGGGPGGNGQTVEFYNGPGFPGSGSSGQRVEFYGGPATYTPNMGQPGAGFQQANPQAVSSPAPTVTNQPQQILPQAIPTLSTQAGDQVAPTPMMRPESLTAALNQPPRYPNASPPIPGMPEVPSPAHMMDALIKQTLPPAPPRTDASPPQGTELPTMDRNGTPSETTNFDPNILIPGLS